MIFRYGKKKVKKCGKCGDVDKSYFYGSYCEVCAAEVWDAGFESTKQHAEEISKAALEEEIEINELLNHPPLIFDSLRELIEYRSGTFRCKKCKKLRLIIII